MNACIQSRLRRLGPAAILSALALSACGGGGVGGSPTGPGTGELTATTGTPYAETFPAQKEAPSDGKVDILFMIDSSASLQEKAGKISLALPKLIAELSPIPMYRIAFAFAWYSASVPGSPYGGTGTLFSGSHGSVFSSDNVSFQTDVTDTIDEIRTLMGTNALTDDLADGGEMGMYSLGQLLQPVNFQKAQDAGFFRSDAAFVTVFVSDENDICAIYPDGVAPVADPNGTEQYAHAHFCGFNTSDPSDDITPRNLLALAKKRKGSQPVQFSAFVYTGPKVPTTDEDEIGYGYFDPTPTGNGAVNVSGGVAADLAASSYETGLRNIGNAAYALITKLQRKFVLAKADANPLSIRAYVDGESVGFRFLPNENAVLLDYAGHSGSVIKINYRYIEN